LRVFGAFPLTGIEQLNEQVSRQRGTGVNDDVEQVVRQMKQEIEHLNTLISSKDAHIDSLKQAMLLIEHQQKQSIRRHWWQFWKKS